MEYTAKAIEVITKEYSDLCRIRNTKAYSSLDEAHYHGVRKALIEACILTFNEVNTLEQSITINMKGNAEKWTKQALLQKAIERLQEASQSYGYYQQNDMIFELVELGYVTTPIGKYITKEYYRAIDNFLKNGGTLEDNIRIQEIFIEKGKEEAKDGH